MEISHKQQLQCPVCATPVPAENVNIQQMVAVCPACDTVFRFGERGSTKIKRRKFKQPDGFTVTETPDGVSLSFPQRVSADDRKGLFIGMAVGSFTGFLGTLMLTEDAPVFFALLMLTISLVMYTTAFAMLVNRRHVTVDEDTISTRQGPVPVPIPGEEWAFAEKSLLRQDVVRVFCEQTEESRQSGQLNRYYHVCLGLPDGERVFLVKSLPQAHAFFTAQVLEETLFEKTDTVNVAARLAEDTDVELPADEEMSLDGLLADGEYGHDLDV